MPRLVTWLVAGGAGERDVPAEFEAQRKLIETVASARFDQTSTRTETSLVRIFAKHISTAQRGRKDTDQETDPEDPFGEVKMGSSDDRPTFAVRMRSDEAGSKKRLNNNQLGTRSFRVAVLYLGYSLRDELRLHCPQY